MSVDTGEIVETATILSPVRYVSVPKSPESSLNFNRGYSRARIDPGIVAKDSKSGVGDAEECSTE
jgi:hypothetical protein